MVLLNSYCTLSKTTANPSKNKEKDFEVYSINRNQLFSSIYILKKAFLEEEEKKKNMTYFW
jgi:hypothetical protein